MKTRILLLILFLALPWGAWAFDISEVSVHGFISQGYLKSQENNWLADSKDGTTQLNEAGLTFSTDVSDNLRIGMQLLARDLGDEGNNEVLLDWGFADYRVRDWFGVRAGKVKTPIGIYNEGRDSDFLRPMAFLPQSIYDENKRNLMVATQGAGLYGNLSLGMLGDLDYNFVYGSLNFTDDSGQARGLEAQAISTAKARGLGTVTDFSADNEYATGGSLVFNTSLDGLRLGASLFEGKTNFDITLLDVNTGLISHAEGQGRNEEFWVASLEYALPWLVLSAEYTEATQGQQMFGMPVSKATSMGYYGMLTARLHEQLSLSVLYDTYYADKDDKDGKKLVAQGKPDHLGWRKDLGIGLRYDINRNWLLKAEWHTLEGGALGLPVYNPGVPIKEDWEYFVVKTSFNF